MLCCRPPARADHFLSLRTGAGPWPGNFGASDRAADGSTVHKGTDRHRRTAGTTPPRHRSAGAVIRRAAERGSASTAAAAPTERSALFAGGAPKSARFSAITEQNNSLHGRVGRPRCLLEGRR